MHFKLRNQLWLVSYDKSVMPLDFSTLLLTMTVLPNSFTLVITTAMFVNLLLSGTLLNVSLQLSVRPQLKVSMLLEGV